MIDIFGRTKQEAATCLAGGGALFSFTAFI